MAGSYQKIIHKKEVILILNHHNNQPLYIQLAETLKYLIIRKNPHDQMMSEREISEEYNVSRTTVRLALSELEKTGYIYKLRRQGTFVTGLSEERQNMMDGLSFTDYTKKVGKKPNTLVVSFRIETVSDLIGKQMGLKQGEEVYRFERIRLANSEPMIFEVSYLPVYLFPNLNKEDLSAKPLYELFKEDYDQTIKFADEEISSSLVTQDEAEMLGIDFFSSCLRIQRTTYNRKNLVIEYTLSVARSDKFVYTIRHIN